MRKLTNFLTLILVLIANQSFSQNAPLTIRGHYDDDLYVRCGSGVENLFLYLTASGDTIQMKSSTIYFAINMTPETTPGKIYGHNFQEFGESIDYGKTFHLKEPFVNDYTSIEEFYGGEIPGEFIIHGFDHVTNHYVIYKTTDYFSNYTLVDSNGYLENAEIGHVSGEIYTLPVRSNGTWILHSLNYGADFDSLIIDNSIIDVNQGRYFQTLSRGSVQGELFLVTHKQNVSLTENYYSIYHSIDFGASWELKSTHTFNSDRQGFTAGRGLCKFYITNLNPTPGTQYNTLQIYTSSDCGETFTLHEYQLTPDVGLPEEIPTSKSQILISPNPATNKINIVCQNTLGELCIEILNVQGEQVMMNNYHNQEIIEMDISKLKAGIYLLNMHSKNRIETSKLVIQ